jgi:mono/diheme cytochrome c family protein
MLLAASTQRTIGFVILAIVFLGGLAYIFFNIRSAKVEIGSEIELAPNRSPALLDEDLEGRRLDIALLANLLMLTLIAIALPFYWLGEPGREDGRNVDTARIFTNRGESIYVEGAQCVNCHGAAGAGGSVTTSITDDDGGFVAQVVWKAPALNTVLSRFTEDEVLHTLNFGRNGVMPAWGAGGGGPLTDQQLEEIVFYLRSIQIDADTIAAEVDSGITARVEEWIVEGVDDDGNYAVDADYLTTIRDADAALLELTLQVEERDLACADVTDEDPDDLALCDEFSEATQASLDAHSAGGDALSDDAISWLADMQGVAATAREVAIAADPTLDDESNYDETGTNDALRWAALELLSDPDSDLPRIDEYRLYGEFVFTNPAASSTYSCARCHTYGYSFGAADRFTARANGTTESILPDGYDQGKGFFGPNLTGGSTVDEFGTARTHAQFIEGGQTIGQTYGVSGSGGNGQMPGFGANVDGAPIGPGIANGTEFAYPALLTSDQIDAVVAFERTLP